MEAVVGTDGLVRLGGYAWRCCVGRGGVRVHKQEGDGATPAGVLPLRRVLFRADRGPAPATAVPVEPIAPDDGWCDDPGDRRYNRAVRLPYEGRHETLWRDDGLYDIVGVLGWNDAPVRRGAGLGDLPARGPTGLRAYRGLRRPGPRRLIGPARGGPDCHQDRRAGSRLRPFASSAAR